MSRKVRDSFITLPQQTKKLVWEISNYALWRINMAEVKDRKEHFLTFCACIAYIHVRDVICA
jgi:hypothetical protein